MFLIKTYNKTYNFEIQNLRTLKQINEISDIKIFRSKLKEYLPNNAFYSVEDFYHQTNTPLDQTIINHNGFI